MISIRQVYPNKSPKALDDLKRLHLECFRAAEMGPMLFTEGNWWLAYDEGVAVAFCGMHRSVRWSDVAYLSRSGIAVSHRGKGLQRRLIRTRIALAKRAGANWAITDTRRNPASANSLIACGFRMYEPTVPWSFKDACYWRKELK